jgi:hypothetical protein
VKFCGPAVTIEVMARAINAEDWLLESDDGPIDISEPEGGDAIDQDPIHRLGPPRISFGYPAVDAWRVLAMLGQTAWLADTTGRRVKVRLERIDPELKVVVGEVIAARPGDPFIRGAAKPTASAIPINPRAH